MEHDEELRQAVRETWGEELEFHQPEDPLGPAKGCMFGLGVAVLTFVLGYAINYMLG